MQIEGMTVLVVGTGKSGIAATELLISKGIDTVLFDGNKELDVDKLYKENPGLSGIPLLLGELDEDTLQKVSICVLSPGVPTDLPMVNEMREKGIKIWQKIRWRAGNGACMKKLCKKCSNLRTFPVGSASNKVYNCIIPKHV